MPKFLRKRPAGGRRDLGVDDFPTNGRTYSRNELHESEDRLLHPEWFESTTAPRNLGEEWMTRTGEEVTSLRNFQIGPYTVNVNRYGGMFSSDFQVFIDRPGMDTIYGTMKKDQVREFVRQNLR